MNKMINTPHNEPFWDVQLSIANAAAKQPQPTIDKLHIEILEEIGRIPSLDLVEYFADIANIPDKEVEKYLSRVGSHGAVPKNTHNDKRSSDDFVDSMARDGQATVQQFRQAFKKEFGKAPSKKLTKSFLQKIEEYNNESGTRNIRVQLVFAEVIALSPRPSLSKLQVEFTKKFGEPPSDEIIKFFLQKLPSTLPDLDETDEYEENLKQKIQFAKKIAIDAMNNFQQSFKSAYKEEPSSMIIDAFLQQLKATTK